MLRSCARCQLHLRQTLIRGSVQIKTLDNQTDNILPVSLTMSLSIQLMTTFKPSSGIQSNLVGIYFISRSIACTVSACAAPCTSSVSINAWSISIGLTRASSKWICFGYVWNRDVTVLQFGYAAFMVEICYVRWSILDQSLHWDLFMRDIMRNVTLWKSMGQSWYEWYNIQLTNGILWSGNSITPMWFWMNRW